MLETGDTKVRMANPFRGYCLLESIGLKLQYHFFTRMELGSKWIHDDECLSW